MKPDEGHRLTDAELKKLERRIAAEYKKATDELTDKINVYFESFRKRGQREVLSGWTSRNTRPA